MDHLNANHKAVIITDRTYFTKSSLIVRNNKEFKIIFKLIEMIFVR